MWGKVSGLLLAALCLACLPAACGRGPGTLPAVGPEFGRIQFATYCAACHSPDGRGVEGGGPPLAGSPWVAGSEGRLIRIVLHGLRGPIKVGGETYNREMLAFGPILTDADIAAVLTFLRRNCGGPSNPVSPAAVERIRAVNRDRTEYCTVEELEAVP